jgi:hypothetical protein
MMENINLKFDLDLTDFNQKIFDLTGFKIKRFRDYFELSTTIKCYTFNNYQILSNPEDNAELLSMVDTLNNLSTYYYNAVNNMDDDLYKENKLIGKTAIDNMIKLFTDSKYKFMLFTSHDNLLMPSIKYLVYAVLNDLITLCEKHHNVVDSYQEGICPICLSANTYTLIDGTIVCRKCGHRNGGSK